MRTALGAERTRLVSQMLAETVVLSAAGGIAGLLVATWAVAWIGAELPVTSLPPHDPLGFSGAVALFAVGVIIVTGIVSGLAPRSTCRVPTSTARCRGPRAARPGRRRTAAASRAARRRAGAGTGASRRCWADGPHAAAAPGRRSGLRSSESAHVHGVARRDGPRQSRLACSIAPRKPWARFPVSSPQAPSTTCRSLATPGTSASSRRAAPSRGLETNRGPRGVSCAAAISRPCECRSSPGGTSTRGIAPRACPCASSTRPWRAGTSREKTPVGRRVGVGGLQPGTGSRSWASARNARAVRVDR